MRVGIDVSALVFERGVSRYTSNLVTALLAKSDISLSAYGSSFRGQEQLQTKLEQLPLAHRFKRVVIQKIPLTVQELAWKVGFNPIANSLPNLEVFHSWDWLQPPDKNLPLVSTIHDLALLRFPETAHPKIKAVHERSWKILKERKAHIITVSRATKNDAVELLGFNPSQVHVIYEALPVETISAANSVTEEQHEKIKNKLQLTQPFLLCVGTREPRKNLVRIIKAWQPFAKDYDLIVAGESGWDESEKLQSIHPGLRFLGKVSNVELNVLYAEAEILLYASLYEGFGLPILEAFYHGTPVVTSTTSSLPEVSGNAAELVDPLSVESISQGITTILNETTPEQQKRLQKMIVRLHLFDWNRTANATTLVYQKAIDDHT